MSKDVQAALDDIDSNAVSKLLEKEEPLPSVTIHHVDITCDGCECEPIIGKRYQCTVCNDIDLCESCARTVIHARVSIATEIGSLPPPSECESKRPRRWIDKMKSDDKRIKWQALQTAVPCLHPSHVLQKIISGPERAIVCTHITTERDDDSDAKNHIREYLRILKPSVVSCNDAAWLHCSTKKALHYTSPTEEQSIMEALDDWEEICTSTKMRPDASHVDKIAKKYNLLTGKWMCFPSRREADEAWMGVVHALVEGKLPGCSEVKISTASASRDDKHVLIAYTEDYTKANEVRDIANALAAALPGMGDDRLLYKPDIYTHLGLYARNECGLKPTIYTASVMKSNK